MKKGLVSKLNLLAHPTYLLMAALAGLVVGSNSSEIFLVLAFFVCLLAIGAILLRFKAAAIIIFFSCGILVGQFHQYFLLPDLSSGCLEVTIESRPRQQKNDFLYKTSLGFLIRINDGGLKISDRVSFCLKDKVQLQRKDERYLLSQYRTAEVYEVQDLKLLGAGHGFRNSLQEFSSLISSKSAKLFSADQGVLAYGVVFGGGDFSRELKNDFKRSGTTHIVAVSGYNVSIITAWLFDWLRQIGKNFAGISSLVILIVYYFITGGSASVLRAAVMGVIILLNKFIGRRVQALHILVLAALGILLFNPYAIFDWGFQLSFMATAGLFFLAPLLESRLAYIKINKTLLKTFCETLGAQIFVLPIMIGSFGSFSLIAPLTNLLILPFIPILMAMVFATLMLGLVYQPLGIFAAGLTKIILVYIISIVKVSARIPYASINYQLPPVLALTAGYLVVFGLTYFLGRSSRAKSKQNF